MSGMDRSSTCRRRPSGNRRSGAAGFTLLEILVIIVVFLALAVIVGPLTLRLMVRLRIEGYADQVSMLVQKTRAQAVRENRAYTIDWDGDAIVPSGPGISEAALLAADAHGLSRYVGAPCLDHDGDGNDESLDPPLTFDGLGAPSGLVAFCFADPPRASSGKSNILQVRIDSTAGLVKIAKLIEDPSVATGVRFASEDTEKFEWEWY